MDFEIAEPAFKCKTDEEVFFQRIAEITGFQKVVRKNRRLYVSVFESDQQATFDQVQNIAALWHTSFEKVE